MRMFKEWFLAKESFTHPSNVPMDFAMAIYQIMHNQAGYEEWELIDSKVATDGLNKVMQHIEDILIANGLSEKDIKREKDWFYGEITGHKNNYN